ncbi:pyruvate formate lyase family protein [Escherichia coli]
MALLRYLAAVKSQNGGAMSLGRTASFLDISSRDFKAGVLNEQQAQELIHHFIMKIVWEASCVHRI